MKISLRFCISVLLVFLPRRPGGASHSICEILKSVSLTTLPVGKGVYGTARS